MIIDEVKLKEQKLALTQWKNNNGIGTVVGATGFGKTYVSILAIKALNFNLPNEIINVVVPTTKLKEDWINENGHINQHNLKNVNVYVINTYIKSEHICKFLIIDEYHLIAADTFIRTLKNTTYDFLMTLTATLERLDGKHELLKEYSPIVYSLSSEQARKMGFISNYTIFNLGIDLNEKEKKEYEKISTIFNQYFKYFDFIDIKRIIAYASSASPRWIDNKWEDAPCIKYARNKGWQGDTLEVMIERYKTNKNNQEINKLKPKKEKRIKMLPLYQLDLTHTYSPDKIMKAGILFMTFMKKRSNFGYNLERKLNYIKEIVNKLEGQIITFSETQVMADKVVDVLGEDICLAYHTGIRSKKQKALALEKIEKSEIRVISTVKALVVGFNVENLKIGINISQNRSKVTRQQKQGRISRKDYDDLDKMAIVINLYIEDFEYNGETVFSQEKRTIKENQKGTKPIWIKNINQITEYLTQQVTLI